jgi:hypothetical protein
MRQIYSLSKTVCFVLALLGFTSLQAQSPTTVTTTNTCDVVQDFNTTDGDFTTPSIYSDQYDYQFNWSGAGPTGRMISSSDPFFTPYQVSMISPIYVNTNPNGVAVVGFSYTAPAGTYYRIRVIRPNLVSGGADVMAITTQGPPLPNGIPNWRELTGGSGTICLQLQDADLVSGEPLRYELVVYVTSLAAPVTIDNFALNSAAPSPLPVTFMGVVANQTDMGVDIRWDVADEVDVVEYQLEKSLNGSDFTTVKSIPAAQKSVYGTSDHSAKQPVVFYRIKSVDIDGSFKYSGIVKLMNGTTSGKLKAYPSPATTQVTIQHKQLAAGARVTVSTMEGRIVKTMAPASGLTNTMIDISSLPSGMYMIRLDHADGKIETTRLVKQ